MVGAAKYCVCCTPNGVKCETWRVGGKGSAGRGRRASLGKRSACVERHMHCTLNDVFLL